MPLERGYVSSTTLKLNRLRSKVTSICNRALSVGFHLIPVLNQAKSVRRVGPAHDQQRRSSEGLAMDQQMTNDRPTSQMGDISDDCQITRTVSPTNTSSSTLTGKRKSRELQHSEIEKNFVRQPREIVDSLQLSKLISSYNVHFVAYSVGRVKVTQTIPNAVWKLVYADYMRTFPDSSLKEFNLKDRVRETLAQLETGNSNEKNSNTAALQSDAVLSDLKLTDSHAKRNVLSHRAKIIAMTAKKLPPGKLEAAKNDSECSVDISVQKSKHTMLSEQVDAITSISESLQTSVSTKEKLATAKLNGVLLKNLKDLHDLGVISEEDFCTRARELFHL